jgi:hypothetical protein
MRVLKSILKSSVNNKVSSSIFLEPIVLPLVLNYHRGTNYKKQKNSSCFRNHSNSIVVGCSICHMVRVLAEECSAWNLVGLPTRR